MTVVRCASGRSRRRQRSAERRNTRSLLSALVNDAVLERAFTWLCHRRCHYPDAADVWSFRQHWPEEKQRLQAELRAGRFRFGLLSRITDTHGEPIDLWSARDALVLKALTWLLAERLPMSRRCTHLKGHGGSKGAVRAVRKHVPRNRFVCRTDVASYYASIDHGLLLSTGSHGVSRSMVF